MKTKSIKKWINLFCILIFLSGCNMNNIAKVSNPLPKEPADKEGLNLAPDFQLEDLDGNKFTLSSYRNKQPVVLFFWTTWCPSCRKDLKILNEVYDEIKQDGLELLSINIAEPVYKVTNIMERYDLNLITLLDIDAKAANAFGFLGVPTYIIINKKGEIVYLGNILPEQNYKELIAK